MMAYDANYFEWQKTVGEFGGKANLFKFSDYICVTDNILDFGCGGGYLLDNIPTVGRKVGIEINPVARVEAESKGIECFRDFEKVNDNSFDVIISNHALEHVENPVQVLKEFKRVAKHGALVVVVVPQETSKAVNMDDHNMHLYTWTPQNLVNLFKVCGIEVIKYKTICHTWIPHFQKVQKLVGWNVFHKLCRLYCRVKKQGYQTCVVGVVNKDTTGIFTKVLQGFYEK